jgi:SPP1 family predicted phage head-tail adaptor
MIGPGKLKHLITLRQKTLVPDGYGGYTETWADVAQKFALIEPVKAMKRFEAMQLGFEVTHTITMRKDLDLPITADMKIVFDGRTFDILSVIDVDEDDRYLEISCKEVVPVGA